MEAIDSTAGIVAVAAGAVAVLALLIALIAVRRLRRLGAAQRAVFGETGRDDLVAHGVETRRRVDEARAEIEEIARDLAARMESAEERLDGSVSRIGVLRYDAFSQNSGRQSSSVAMLDELGNGVVISAILQREQARVYAKPLRDGQSELDLSPEEIESIRIAEENARR